MMKRVASVCLLGLRAALRSRLVVALLILLALVATAIKGDGTPTGELRMQLTWTLGIAFAVLGAASLWIGCSAVAGDIETGRHVGTAVSPVRPFEIWLGRWLSLVIINGFLLAFVMAALLLQLRINGFSSKDTAVSRLLPLDPAAIERLVLSTYDYAQSLGALREDAKKEDVLASIRDDLLTSYTPVDPGQRRRWGFLLEEGDAALPLRVEFSYISAAGTAGGSEGICQVYNEAGDVVASRKVDENDIGAITFYVPVGALNEGTRKISVTFENTEDLETGSGVLVHHMESLKVFVPDGGLVWNMFKCWLALISMLALLSAIGVTCGTLFSFPVAAFTATGLVCLLLLGQGTLFEEGVEVKAREEMAEGGPTVVEVVAAKASGAIFRAVNSFTAPFTNTHALDRLGDGVALDIKKIGRCVFWTSLAQPIGFGILGALVLRRREL